MITLKREYDTINKQLKIEYNVAKYKEYLFFAFIGLEFLLNNFLQYEDIIGFANFQKEKINDYETVLMEIGEKYYVDEKGHLPPELRLCGLILFNAFTFVGLKWIGSSMSSGFGSGGGSSILGSLLGSLMGGNRQKPVPQQNENQFARSGNQMYEDKPKPRMRTPDIDLDELTIKKTS